VLYQPQAKQILLHQSSAEETLYGGAAGGGKSFCMLWDAYTYCVHNPGARTIMFRRTYPELEKSLIFVAKAIFTQEMGKYNETKKRWEIFTPAGKNSYIEFGHCKDEGDVYDYQSAEYDAMYFDELTHFTEFQYLYLKTRLRSSKGFRVKVVAATNPGNIGHGWVRRRWRLFDKNLWYKMWRPIANEDEPRPATRMFIQALLTDNRKLIENDPSYENRLKSLPANQKKQLLYGDWDIFSGQAFPEWNPNRHVIKRFDIPDKWDRWVSIDFGFAKPFSAHWYTQDPDTKHTYIYREFYSAGVRDVIQAQRVVAMSTMPNGIRESISYNIADPSIWAQKGSGMSIAEVYSTNGLNCLPACNDRIQGKMRVHDYLADAPDGKPWLQIFDNCINMIRTLPELVLDEHNTEDVNTKQEDHAYDDLRYFLMSRQAHGSYGMNESEKYQGIDRASQDEWERVKKMFLKREDANRAIGSSINEIQV
jgi:hypothetical protein